MATTTGYGSFSSGSARRLNSLDMGMPKPPPLPNYNKDVLWRATPKNDIRFCATVSTVYGPAGIYSSHRTQDTRLLDPDIAAPVGSQSAAPTDNGRRFLEYDPNLRITGAPCSEPGCYTVPNKPIVQNPMWYSPSRSRARLDASPIASNRPIFSKNIPNVSPAVKIIDKPTATRELSGAGTVATKPLKRLTYNQDRYCPMVLPPRPGCSSQPPIVKVPWERKPTGRKDGSDYWGYKPTLNPEDGVLYNTNTENSDGTCTDSDYSDYYDPHSNEPRVGPFLTVENDPVYTPTPTPTLAPTPTPTPTPTDYSSF